MKKTVKAWIAVVPSDKYRPFNPAVMGLSVYLFKREALNYASDYKKFVPCTITYELKRSKERRKHEGR